MIYKTSQREMFKKIYVKKGKLSDIILGLRGGCKCCSGATEPWLLKLFIFLHQLEVIRDRFYLSKISTLFDQYFPVFLIVLPFFWEMLDIIFRIRILQLIDYFLHRSMGTMFSLRMPLVSALRSLAFSSRKVYLLEGMVRGMILMVLRMGSVSILSMRESRFSFCFTI